MWLNLIILSVSSLVVGFILGWITACPRRWDAYISRDRTSRDRAPLQDDPPPLPQVTTTP